MTTDEIKLLLSKYYEAESTLEEEKQLQNLFLSGNYPPEFADDAKVFIFYALAARKRQTVRKRIDDPEFEKEMDELLLSIPDSARERNLRRIPWLAAATILLLAALFFTFRHNYLGREEAASILKRRIEFNQAIVAMDVFSSNLKSGLPKVKPHLEQFNYGPVTLTNITNFNNYQPFITNQNETRSIN
jgi:hypothetical protein